MVAASPRFAFYGETKPPALQQGATLEDEDVALGAMYDNVPVSEQTSQKIVWDLVQGNHRFVKARSFGPTRTIDDTRRSCRSWSRTRSIRGRSRRLSFRARARTRPSTPSSTPRPATSSTCACAAKHPALEAFMDDSMYD
jgi:hypothetical protein